MYCSYLASSNLLGRYLTVVLGGTNNPHRGAVAKDIVDAVLSSRATADSPATYRAQPEQERRLQAAFDKWSKVSGVWSAAASKVCSSPVIFCSTL
jgi:hypothetical protein